MQSQTLAKPVTAKLAKPGILEQQWLPLPQTGEGVRNLDEALRALTDAERVIRNQAERINHLEGLAMTDELTGLLNRRGFTMSLNRELALAKRDPAAAGILVMIDLDGFKSINDIWGHGVGDDYLQVVAHTLMSTVRTSDVVARLGGDEFAILFPRMNENTGIQRLAKLERDFNGRTMRYGDRALPLRASFGLAAYNAADNNIDVLLAKADVKLYAHKASRKA